MRDRLIELISKSDEECKHTKDCKNCSGYGKGSMCMNYHIADYLLANGVIVPPVKVGDEVWMIDKVFDSKKRQHKTEVCEFVVRSISVSCNSKNVWIKKFRICQVKDGKIISHQHNISFAEIGKTVFLSREKAEAKLKEGKG